MLVTGVKTVGQVLQNSDSTRYKKFLPDYVKMQFAGGIGFVSMGVGYTFLKQKLEVSYFYGYVPKFVSTDDLHSVSLQLTAKLLRFKVKNNIEVMPLNFGWFIHHTFGTEYWIKLPDHYPLNIIGGRRGEIREFFWVVKLKQNY